MLFIIMKKVTRQATRSTKFAADLSNLFFLIAVNAILFNLLNRSFIVYFLLLFMLGVIVVITMQWRKELEINIMRAVRVVWRAGFIILVITYTILLPIGIYITYL
ncbi:DUF3397 family protein [Piscibacillus salipiscarius]|uniref:DUF3397 family protein n=1 Tax=Piscibacillus salipiscarius TaxID=299480 RepID=UPI0034E2ABA1